MNKLLISVVIPLYNKEKTIKKTLNSILLQSYSNYEIVIVDDGSTDDSYSIVSNYVESNIEKQRIRLLHQENGMLRVNGSCFLTLMTNYFRML